MKYVNKRWIITALSLFFFATSTAFSSMEVGKLEVLVKSIQLKIQEQATVSMDTLIYNNHIYVPIRYVVENLGSKVCWDSTTNSVSIEAPKNFTDFSEANPLQGESFVYGEILAIDKGKQILTIEEHYDDNSQYIDPHLTVTKDLIIILQRNDKKMNLSFDDLKIGDTIGAVLNKNESIRGIIINH